MTEIRNYRDYDTMSDGTDVWFKGSIYGCSHEACKDIPCLSAGPAFRGDVEVGDKLYKNIAIEGSEFPFCYAAEDRKLLEITDDIVKQLRNGKTHIKSYKTIW